MNREKIVMPSGIGRSCKMDNCPDWLNCTVLVPTAGHAHYNTSALQ